MPSEPQPVEPRQDGSLPVRVPSPPAQRAKLFLFFLACLAAGIAGLYYLGYRTYVDINNGAPEIHLHAKGLFASPLILVIGLIGMVVCFIPKQPREADGKPRRLPFLTASISVLLVGSVIAGGALYFWLRHYAAAQGYQV